MACVPRRFHLWRRSSSLLPELAPYVLLRLRRRCRRRIDEFRWVESKSVQSAVMQSLTCNLAFVIDIPCNEQLAAAVTRKQRVEVDHPFCLSPTKGATCTVDQGTRADHYPIVADRRR